MSVKSLLLWEKWRPKNLEELILLPRIRKQFENGVTQHYIFYGHFGTGKTSLARILIGKYQKNVPHLELNCSIDTSIDILRSEIDRFCKTQPMMDSDSDIKYVFLDEFERVSVQFQDAFKAFLEKYNRNVRFIITTNHINKISDGLKSRIKTLNFDCQEANEEKFLKREIFSRIKNIILPNEGKEIPKEILGEIINKKFPDFRETIVEIQNYLEVGETGTVASNVNLKVKLELYNLIFEKDLSYENIYHFLMSSFGPDGVETMIKLFGKSFIDWIISEKETQVENLFKANYIIADYTEKLQTNTDPLILGMTIIGKLRDIFI
jgi:DNA polymerase III delta prime subunit